MDTLLISLHSRHSKNIFDGKKTIELRKKGVRKVDRILIYETLPTAAIIGYCQAGEVLCNDAQTFCTNYQSSLCLTAREIWDYLGNRMGYGIRIKNPQRIKPISLSKMKELGIAPPQSYHYLSEKHLEELISD